MDDIFVNVGVLLQEECDLNLIPLFRDGKVQSKNDGSIDEILCRILDGNLDLSIDVSDSKIWLHWNIQSVLKEKSVGSKDANYEDNWNDQSKFGSLIKPSNPYYWEWFKAADWTARNVFFIC
ncbi:hypothetical protein RHSIM_Rhsim03G0091600 [Rhododendron simsii]|uniref:Uncharacterized protein n=1 Tax=Rhododendron simsii TaxID=118357 RepID=A0A834HGN6_RHOSS|nr:hypothetical protein RHSIM_Rhsim03G0091600 [Rhododendron simsii]